MISKGFKASKKEKLIKNKNIRTFRTFSRFFKLDKKVNISLNLNLKPILKNSQYKNVSPIDISFKYIMI